MPNLPQPFSFPQCWPILIGCLSIRLTCDKKQCQSLNFGVKYNPITEILCSLNFFLTPLLGFWFHIVDYSCPMQETSKNSSLPLVSLLPNHIFGTRRFAFRIFTFNLFSTCPGSRCFPFLQPIQLHLLAITNKEFLKRGPTKFHRLPPPLLQRNPNLRFY